MPTKKLRRQPLNSVNNSRWLAYATAGAATTFAVTCPEIAQADIHYVDPADRHFQGIGTSSGYDLGYFQLTAPGESFGFIHVATTSSAEGVARFIIGGGATFVSAGFRGFVAGGFPYVNRLVSGQNISAGAFVLSSAHFFGTMAFRGGYGNDQFLAPGIGFIGFEFNLGGGLQYGWVRVSMDGAPNNSFTVLDYAWGDVGTAIAAGQVPEPGSLGLLALGGVGLLAWRKRRTQTAAKS